MTDLLHAELDRALPGKRQALRSANPDALRDALGLSRPQPGSAAREWSAAVIDSLRDDPATGRPAA